MTRLGLSTCLLAAIVFLFGMSGGIMVTAIAVGYVLLFEEDKWLKRAAVKAIVLVLGFVLVDHLVSFLPNMLNYLNSIVNLFNGYINFGVIRKIFDVLGTTVSYARYLVFLAMVILALSGKTIPVPFVDGLIDKHFGAEETEE